mmetsp:Transcript_24497/g.56442  ORF Transcript_24497/g.56442 Transcript_24497/m.56442 type:complete len:335 (+) Transcript_24497:63-1067(+)
MPSSDEFVPYAQRPEWSDVQPVAQDDGPEPVAVIRYPPFFEDVHGYFRAVQQSGEFSQRVMELTADVIEHNSANYTAWYYRRRCLKELGLDLAAELEFTDQWAADSPKNYQVWYHRRWLIAEIAAGIAAQKSADVAEAEIAELARRELQYHQEVMQRNDDFKNYNGWSHRQFIVRQFKLWDGELDFILELLDDDIRNNSAWNHRYTVVKNLHWPFSRETIQSEVDFTLGMLEQCYTNESAWNYLSAFTGDGEGKRPLTEFPAVEALCLKIIAESGSRLELARFAIETLALVHEARGETQQAVERYGELKRVDKIRVCYWDWRIACLQHIAAPTQ